MPKLKTNKSVSKRFKITKKGKVKRNKQGRRHLLTDKSSSKKRSMRKQVLSEPSEVRRIKKLMPYG